MEFLMQKYPSKRGGEARVLIRPDWSTFDDQKIRKLVTECIEKMHAHIEEVITQKPSFQRLVVLTEELFSPIETLNACVQNMCEAMSTPLVRELGEWMAGEYSSLGEYMWMNLDFYRVHRSFRMMKAYKLLTKEEQVVFDLQFGRFRASGAFLPKDKCRRIEKYERELEILQEQFAENIERSQQMPAFSVTDPACVSGINEQVVLLMKEEARARNTDGFVALTNVTHRCAILEGADYRPLREAVFRAHEVSASEKGAGGKRYDNRPVAERILLVRERIALLYGFQNYAQHTIRSHMSGSPKIVRRFLRGMIKPIVQTAKTDFARLEKFAKAELGHELKPWDVEYVRRKYIKKEYGCTGDELHPFLSLPAVLQVLFRLVARQYGCRVVESATPNAWHPSVRFFEVYEHGGQLLGGFYLDLYARSGEFTKVSEYSWARSLVSRRRTTLGDIVVPLVVLHTGLVGSGEGNETHLSHHELVILFHEFGHLLEMLFDKAHFLANGISAREEDVCEVASLFMENWAWDIEVLAEIIGLHTRRRKIPLGMLLAIHRQRSVVQSLGNHSLLYFLTHALVDLELHSRPVQRGMIPRVVREVFTELEVPLLLRTGEDQYPNNYGMYFTIGYVSTMYSYLWSWKFAAAIRAVHLRGARSIDPIVSRRFRREFIEASSMRTTKESLTAFFGTQLPSSKALLEYSRRI